MPEKTLWHGFIEIRVSNNVVAETGKGFATHKAAIQVAEICVSGPSGVKTPEENADFMSCLKARPTKLKTFFRNLYSRW